MSKELELGPWNMLSMIQVDGHLICLSSQGKLYLIRPDPSAFNLLGQFQAIKSDKWICLTGPVIAQGRLYLRAPERLVCYDLLK